MTKQKTKSQGNIISNSSASSKSASYSILENFREYHKSSLILEDLKKQDIERISLIKLINVIKRWKLDQEELQSIKLKYEKILNENDKTSSLQNEIELIKSEKIGLEKKFNEKINEIEQVSKDLKIDNEKLLNDLKKFEDKSKEDINLNKKNLVTKQTIEIETKKLKDEIKILKLDQFEIMNERTNLAKQLKQLKDQLKNSINNKNDNLISKDEFNKKENQLLDEIKSLTDKIEKQQSEKTELKSEIEKLKQSISSNKTLYEGKIDELNDKLKTKQQQQQQQQQQQRVTFNQSNNSNNDLFTPEPINNKTKKTDFKRKTMLPKQSNPSISSFSTTPFLKRTKSLAINHSSSPAPTTTPKIQKNKTVITATDTPELKSIIKPKRGISPSLLSPTVASLNKTKLKPSIDNNKNKSLFGTTVPNLSHKSTTINGKNKNMPPPKSQLHARKFFEDDDSETDDKTDIFSKSIKKTNTKTSSSINLNNKKNKKRKLGSITGSSLLELSIPGLEEEEEEKKSSSSIINPILKKQKKGLNDDLSNDNNKMERQFSPLKKRNEGKRGLFKF